MDHRGGMTRNFTAETDIRNEMSPRLYLKDHVSSCHDFCKYGSKHDSILPQGNERVPTHLATSKIRDEDCSPKRFGTAVVRHNGDRYRLKTAFQREESVSEDSGVNYVTHLQNSDASSELIECMSEESVNMKSRTLLPFLKSIKTFEQNNGFLETGSLEESVVMVPDASSSTFDEIVSIDGVPWAWSDGFSDESVVMEVESPKSALESMACLQISHDTELQGSSVDFGVTSQKIISPTSSIEVKECSNSRSSKQETAGTLWKSMKSAVASSSKEQKQVSGLNVDEKQKRELPMLRSSLPVRTSLLGRVKAKKVDEAPEPGIINEKSTTLDRTVKSAVRNKAGVIKALATSLSPIITKKKPLSPPKRIQLSPKSAVLLKTKSLVVKNMSPLIVSGGITGQSTKTVSKLGKEKVLKQVGASQVHKSTIYCSSYSKLRSVKNQVEAGKIDEIKEKTLHAVEHKLIGAALKPAEQKHLNSKSQQSSRTSSFKSSMLSSALILSSSKRENASQLTIKDDRGSKKSQIGEVTGRTSFYDYKRMQKRTSNVSMEDKSLSPGRLSSRTSFSRSSLSCSALVSSSSKEESGSKLIISDVRGSKKTRIGEGKGRTPFYDDKRIQRRTKNVSLEVKSLSPEMMSFRQGKVVSLQKENTGERRLRFMQEKAESKAENFECEIGKSSFRKGRESTTASSACSSPCSPVVVLKHQDVQEKNTHALFNDVIEETANKLVEIRKSKVKALVGAFESIISLQERTVW